MHSILIICNSRSFFVRFRRRLRDAFFGAIAGLGMNADGGAISWIKPVL
jgi:hypothetical protein